MLRKIKNTYHYFQALTAKVLYPFPDHKLKIIGITGTDGKTTTTSLIYHILKTANKRVSMISTVYAKIGGQEYDTGLHVTTPDVFEVYKYIRKSIEAGDEYFVLETTSHALDQNRVGGLNFEVGLITNITHEHLDYHKTYGNYVKAKAKLLLRSKYILLNKDDGSFPLLSSILKKKKKQFETYGLRNPADYQKDLSEKLKQPLAEFNKYNYLAAYAIADKLGIDKKKILQALETFKSPKGRMEKIYDKDFSVIVDFAHTPNAIAEALKTVRTTMSSQCKLIHIFGAAGKRDPSKRPFMGEASAQYADITILTEEDYRTENPEKIAQQIAKGLEKEGMNKVELDQLNHTMTKVYTYVQNRRDAIEIALGLAQPGDVIIATGKGHEKSLARGGREYEWNEIEEIKKMLKQISSKNT